jgi:hypothetical protein
MKTNPRQLFFPAVHKFIKNHQKIKDIIRIMVEKTSCELDKYWMIYEFSNVKENKKCMEGNM